MRAVRSKTRPSTLKTAGRVVNPVLKGRWLGHNGALGGLKSTGVPRLSSVSEDTDQKGRPRGGPESRTVSSLEKHIPGGRRAHYPNCREPSIKSIPSIALADLPNLSNNRSKNHEEIRLYNQYAVQTVQARSSWAHSGLNVVPQATEVTQCM